MKIEAQFRSLRDVIRWIDDNTKGIEISGGHRKQIASACFDVALEHQAAIAILCDSKLFGSMHALMRVLIESVVRGLWLLHCANDIDLERFEKRGIEKHFGDMTAEIEAAIGAHQPTLSQMKKNAWGSLNDFTHTGYIQVTRRHGNGTLGPNYPEEDIIKCLNAAGAYGLIASAQLAAMAKNNDLVQAHLSRMQEFANVP